MKNTGTKYPFHPMVCRIKTKSKTKKYWACWDGDDSIEVYRDLEETNWVATIDLSTHQANYYWTKSAPKPNVKLYKLSIPEIGITINNFNLIRVDWV